MSQQTSFLGTGWSFPPTFTANGRDVVMVSDAEDVHQSLQIILSTRPGERVLREDFGCELSDFMFEEIDQGLISSIKKTIETAITRHEHRIMLDEVIIDQAQDVQGLLMIHLHYTIRSTNSRYNMVYPFYLNEANHPVTT